MLVFSNYETNCRPDDTSQMTVLQGISYATAKKKKGMTVGFVTFENIEQLKNAVQVILCFLYWFVCLQTLLDTITS